MCQTLTSSSGSGGSSSTPAPNPGPDPNRIIEPQAPVPQELNFGKSVTSRSQVTGAYEWELKDMDNFVRSLARAHNCKTLVVPMKYMTSDPFCVTIGTWTGEMILEATVVIRSSDSGDVPALRFHLRQINQKGTYFTVHVTSECTGHNASKTDFKDYNGFINSENTLLQLLNHIDLMNPNHIRESNRWNTVPNIFKLKFKLTFSIWAGNEGFKETPFVASPEILDVNDEIIDNQAEVNHEIDPENVTSLEATKNETVNDSIDLDPPDNVTPSGTEECEKDKQASTSDDRETPNVTSSETGTMSSEAEEPPPQPTQKSTELESSGITLKNPKDPKVSTYLTALCAKYGLDKLTREQKTSLKEFAEHIEYLGDKVLVLQDLDNKETFQQILDLMNGEMETVNVIPNDFKFLQILEKCFMTPLILKYMDLFRVSLTITNCQKALLNSWHLRTTLCLFEIGGINAAAFPHHIALRFCCRNWEELKELKWFPRFVVSHSKMFGLPTTQNLMQSSTWKGCNCSKWDECIHLWVHNDDESWSPNPQNYQLQKPRVYFDVTADGVPIGRIIMELRPDVAPEIADNFRALCTGKNGFGYKGSTIGCLPSQFICGGDFPPGKATGGVFYGEPLPVENTILKHTGPGVLSMSPDNNVNFSITTTTNERKLDCFNKDFIVFGKVVDGMDVLNKIRYFGDYEIVIADCGQI